MKRWSRYHPSKRERHALRKQSRAVRRERLREMYRNIRRNVVWSDVPVILNTGVRPPV